MSESIQKPLQIIHRVAVFSWSADLNYNRQMLTGM